MSNLTASERLKLERLFGMGGGYVLNFSDRTFGEFFSDCGIDIDSDRYRTDGGSKAKRMRAFWKMDDNHIVGRIVDGLIKYADESQCFGDSNPSLKEECERIARRLLSDQPVVEIEALNAINDDRDFELLASAIREAIEKNKPESGLDRLHTFVHKFVRELCKSQGIKAIRDKPLHSIFGEYVKSLRDGQHLESDMTERILKSSISVMDAFNDVRNNKSLAHDNKILNYEESLLIFNHVAASVRFIQKLQEKIKTKERERISSGDCSDIPF